MPGLTPGQDVGAPCARPSALPWASLPGVELLSSVHSIVSSEQFQQTAELKRGGCEDGGKPGIKAKAKANRSAGNPREVPATGTWRGRPGGLSAHLAV